MNSNNIASTSHISIDVQVQLCREVALAFRHLCKTVCETFGHEGEKVIRETFLSDSDLSEGNVPHSEAIFSKGIGVTLIKLLAAWGIRSGSGTK